MHRLDKLFNPQSIALVGATNRPGAVGEGIMRNLIGSGYDGIVYPVNPKRKSILGVKAYPDVVSIADPVDLAIITTPASTVPGILEDCGRAGITAVIIISSGFKEIGEEGHRLFAQMQEIIQRYKIAVVGPNCLGFLRPSLQLNASFSPQMAKPGKIAFISQSGALGTAILDWANTNNVGFSYFISIGSMIDVGYADLIDYFNEDPETESIMIYMETLTHARRFLSAARAFAITKPLIVLKVGKSEQGAKAAMSHTGSLTGNDEVFNAAFKRAGILRVESINEIFDYAQTLAMQRRPAGNRLAIVTNAGGPGVIATDFLIQKDGRLAQLSQKTIDGLNEALSANWSGGNPVDVLGDATPEHYRIALQACLDDENVDGALVILTPQTMTDAAAIARNVVELSKKTHKTILTSWMGAGEVRKGRDVLKRGDVPDFDSPEDAVRSFMSLYQYGRNLELLQETPPSMPGEFVPRTEENRRLLDRLNEEGRTVMTSQESAEFLSNYDIPVVKTVEAATAEEAGRAAQDMGFPVVMKIASQDILHKTEVGGVRLGLSSKEAVEVAFKDMLEGVARQMPEARVDGVFIQQQIKPRYEVLIGSKKDPIFGPVIVFGMGGVAVEVFNDISVGLPPMNMVLAQRLMEDTKIYKLLKGYRNMPAVDVEAIRYTLYKFAYLIMDFPEIQEIDINPFGVSEDHCLAIDVKVVLDKDLLGKDIPLYSQLVISPYPRQYVRETELKDGKPVTLRPISPEDEPLLREMFRHVSEETQRFRFFRTIKEITHKLLVRYTQNDYDREIAIIAERDEGQGPAMIGVGRLIASADNSTAEFAIMVADPWQHIGLGNTLTDYILEIARDRGIGVVFANVLEDNATILHIFEKRGFTMTCKDGMCRCELALVREPAMQG